MSMVVFAQMMDRGDHMDNGNGWWWIMGIVGLLIIIGLVVIIVMTLQRSNAPKPEASDPRRTADDLLSERLARGEIDEDEYRRRRDALRE